MQIRDRPDPLAGTRQAWARRVNSERRAGKKRENKPLGASGFFGCVGAGSTASTGLSVVSSLASVKMSLEN
jgi:hypothetical protein